MDTESLLKSLNARNVRYAAGESPATRRELSETELRLRKDIEGVRLEIKELELRLRKEIEGVRLEVEEVRREIKELELRLQKEIESLKVELSRQTNRLMLIIGGILAVLKLLDYVLPPP